MARPGRPASGLTAGALGLAVATTLVLAVALGHGAADALADAEAGAAGLAGAAALAGAAGLAGTAETDADAEGEAQLASADWLTFVAWFPPATAMTTPRIAANATGMARGTAMRPSRPPGRRCLADRCLVGMQSTSILFTDESSSLVLPVGTVDPGNDGAP
jgi:hypothetical protein